MARETILLMSPKHSVKLFVHYGTKERNIVQRLWQEELENNPSIMLLDLSHRIEISAVFG